MLNMSTTKVLSKIIVLSLLKKQKICISAKTGNKVEGKIKSVIKRYAIPVDIIEYWLLEELINNNSELLLDEKRNIVICSKLKSNNVIIEIKEVSR